MTHKPESARESFMRNHQENVGVMRAALVRAQRDGRTDDAKVIESIIAAWERINSVASKEPPA